MKSVDRHLADILAAVRPLAPLEIDLDHALGTVLAEDVTAPVPLPPFDNSAMDGYAVRSADVSGAPVTLKVVETVYAGQMPKRAIGPGEATRVMTGAPLPPGADAVVMQEKTRALDDGARVEIHEAVTAGTFVRPKGGDARQGAVLLPLGTPIGIPEAALLYAQGIGEVPVPRRPKVALLSTGDELCRYDEAPGDRIVDTNAPALALAVKRAGGEPTILGIARDDPAEVRALFERTRGFDLVLSSAGVSVGERDFVRDALEALGVQVHFWKVAIKPGKPLLFGTLGSALYFGLPGNPASSLVTFEVFVLPALRRMLGHQQALTPRVPGRVAVAQHKPAGLTHFLRATVEVRDGALWAKPLPTQLSGSLRSTTRATHLMVFPKDATRLEPGDPVELIPVSWAA